MKLVRDCVAIILSAGFGSRLQPHSRKLAKPLFPCAGVETIYIILWQLADEGYRDVIVNLHYLSAETKTRIEDLKSALPDDFRIHYSEEVEILGSAGGLYKIFAEFKDLLKAKNILVYNGDICSNLQLSKLTQQNKPAFAVSFDPAWTESYSCIHVSENMDYQGYDGSSKNDKRAHFLGVHFLPSAAWELLSNCEQKFLGLFRHAYPLLIEHDMRPVAIDYDDQKELFWFSIDDEEKLIAAQRLCISQLWQESSMFQTIFKSRFDLVEIEGQQAMAKQGSVQIVVCGENSSVSYKNLTIKNSSVVVDENSSSQELSGCVENSLLICFSEEKRTLNLSSQIMLV